MISYEPLYKRVKEQGLLWGDIQSGIKCSSGTIAKLTHGVPVSLDTIDRLCEFFKCNVDGIIEWKEDK